MKKLFAATVSIAVILSTGTLGVARVAASTAAGSSFAQSGTTRLRFVPRFIRVANKRLRYTIKAKYPQAVGAKDPRIMRLNRAISELMLKQVNDFKKDFKTPGKRMGAVGSDYDSDYSVRHSRNNIVSIAFYVDTYFEGAAHGNHNYLVFNYDLNTGRQIKLADLFKPSSDYLDAIAAYSIKSLKEKLKDESDADWIKSGAEAKDENYKNWNITSRGLEIGFDPYQVAAYVYGPQEVLIPYDALKDVIDPDGPLGRIISR
ncbi:MAG: hypothetical protein QOJ64_2793 [Acidobacteriota bacterium]|jgi:hypothetical protein|nr:hypothetical protein [Acidobacteriota bacterium]